MWPQGLDLGCDLQKAYIGPEPKISVNPVLYTHTHIRTYAAPVNPILTSLSTP